MLSFKQPTFPGKGAPGFPLRTHQWDASYYGRVKMHLTSFSETTGALQPQADPTAGFPSTGSRISAVEGGPLL